MINEPHNDDAHKLFLEELHAASSWLWSSVKPHDRWGYMRFIQKVLSGVAEEFDANPVKHAEWLVRCLTDHEMNSYGYESAYPHILRDSCIGITQRGTRCSRPGSTIGRSGQAYCSQHIDEIPGVWRSIEHLLKQAGGQIQLQSWAAEQLRKPSEAGHVYFAWDCTRYMKIGHTDRLPSTRVDEIQQDRGRTIASPDDVNWLQIELIDSVSGSKRTESTFHAALKRFRVKGEWFEVSKPMIHALESIGVDLTYLIDDQPWLRHAS